MGVAVGSGLMASGHLSIRKRSTQKTQRTQRKGGLGSESREPLPGSAFSVPKNSDYAGAHHDERSFDFRHDVARRRAGVCTVAAFEGEGGLAGIVVAVEGSDTRLAGRCLLAPGPLAGDHHGVVVAARRAGEGENEIEVRVPSIE